MTIEILPSAREDIIAGCAFYEQQEPLAGNYFRDSIFETVEELHVTAGVHRQRHGYHCAVAVPFPWAIYYRVSENVVYVRAVLDCRRDPKWIRRQLRQRPNK